MYFWSLSWWAQLGPPDSLHPPVASSTPSGGPDQVTRRDELFHKVSVDVADCIGVRISRCCHVARLEEMLTR